MRTLLALLLTPAALILWAGLAPAADKALASGPQPKEILPGPFQPYLVLGKPKHKGTHHCLVSYHALNPVVMVLVRGTNPSAENKLDELLKALDAAVPVHERDRLAAFAVFLADDIKPDDKEEDTLKRAVKKSLQEDDERAKVAAALDDRFKELKNVSIAFDWLAGVKKQYKLHDDAEVTVIIYNQYKVLSSHAFRKDELKDAGVTAIMADVEAQLKAIREGLAGKAK